MGAENPTKTQLLLTQGREVLGFTKYQLALDRIRCWGRILVFREFDKAAIEKTKPDVGIARAWYLEYAEQIIPFHDFDIACRQARKKGETRPNKEIFYRKEACCRFGRDVTIALKYSSGEVEVTGNRKTIHDLLAEEYQRYEELGGDQLEISLPNRAGLTSYDFTGRITST